MKKNDENVLYEAELPVIALRGVVMFPDITISIDITRFKSMQALEYAVSQLGNVMLVSQKDPFEEEIDTDRLSRIGTVAKVKSVMNIGKTCIRVSLEGQYKAEIKKYVNKTPFITAIIERSEDKKIESLNTEKALFAVIQQAFENYAALSGRVMPDLIMEIISAETTEKCINIIGAKIAFTTEQRQKLLELNSIEQRGMQEVKYINEICDILSVKNDIEEKIRTKMDENQRRYILREQAKYISDELDGTDEEDEISRYREEIAKAKLPENVEKKALDELSRFKKMQYGSSESSVSRDYLDLLISLPWNKKTTDKFNIEDAQKILEKEHYGLEEVKERVIEFLAVRQYTHGLEAPILCLAGPPGVGKTSVAKSIAKALGRKYVRMSLGGLKDEAEIRGHRKTYVAAMPGRIISSIKQAGVNNPVILLDEIDKLAKDFKGNPESALLEVLDSEQNKTFRDNYLELEFDISDVLFICTANDLSSIADPLRDRFEIIELSSYTHEEKFSIGTKFLIPKQLKKHNLKKSQLKISNEALDMMIASYTREAGVRQLERTIAKVCRKAVRIITGGEKKSLTLKESNIEEILGNKKFRLEKSREKNEIGSVCGLAWTSLGGATLTVDVNIMKGKGEFQITGNIGKVMEESAKASISYIRANSEKLGIKEDFHSGKDIHIHIPEGAVPKDGPSAGITMTTAIVSALTEIPVRGDVAMTGEITIRGKVLAIGGLREKVLAAKAVGIKTVIVPLENKRDIERLPDYAKENIEFVYADDISTVLETALVKEG